MDNASHRNGFKSGYFALPKSLAALALAAALISSAASAAPALNPATPWDKYEVVESGNQLMFEYYARTGLPLDYDKVAGAISQEYRNTSDAFRQHDLMQALRPRIDASLAHAKANPYLRLDIRMASDANLHSYDFQKKGFPLTFFDEDSYRYFNDNAMYKIAFVNGSRYGFLPVPDESKARQIETIKSKLVQPMTLRTYMYASDGDPATLHVKAVITRIVVLDGRGTVLADYTGSVQPNDAKKVEKKEEAPKARVQSGWF